MIVIQLPNSTVPFGGSGLFADYSNLGVEIGLGVMLVGIVLALCAYLTAVRKGLVVLILAMTLSSALVMAALWPIIALALAAIGALLIISAVVFRASLSNGESYPQSEEGMRAEEEEKVITV